jgi:hypothetical protein
MKKKNKSSLPSGGYVPTHGSNYGMDGYDFDFQYNDGVLDSAIHPSVRGMSELPSDVIVGPKSSEVPSDIDLTKQAGNLYGMGDILSDNIVDLSWLDVDHQDLDRLPRNPTDLMIPELAEAWSKSRDKNRFHLYQNNRDLEEIKYRESVDSAPEKEKLSKKAKKEILRRALRRASDGMPLSEVLKKARREAHPNEEDVRTVLAHVEREYGLLGNVYIHSNAYPMCSNGKGLKSLKKQAKSAAYIVASDKCKGCVLAQAGKCHSFQKELVHEVNWKKAARKYIPKLKALNKKASSTGNIKEDLRSAFLSVPDQERHTTNFHIQPNHIASVSDEEAFSLVQGVTPVYKKLVASKMALNKEKKETIEKLKQYKKAGVINNKEFKKLMKSSASPRAIIAAVNQIKLIRKKSSVYGSYDDYSSQQMHYVWRHLDETAKESRIAQEKLDQNIEDRAIRGIHRLLKSNLLTKKEAATIVSLSVPSHHKLVLANQLIQKKSISKNKVKVSKEEVSKYRGYGENGHYISKESGEEAIRELSKEGKKRKADRKKVIAACAFAKKAAKTGWSGPLLQELVAEQFGERIATLAMKEVEKISATTAEFQETESYNAPVLSEMDGFVFAPDQNELTNIEFHKEAEDVPPMKIDMSGFILEF